MPFQNSHNKDAKLKSCEEISLKQKKTKIC